MTDIDTSDRCSFDHLLDDDERVVLRTVREFMANERALKVAPRLRGLSDATSTCRGYGTGCGSSLLDGLINMEIARTDASTAIFNNTHSGLAMRSIRLFGSDYQRSRFLPEMTAYTSRGSFAMPAMGSDETSGDTLGLVAELVGNGVWLLNGEARCVGGVEPATIRIVWAWDRTGRVLNGFVVHEDLDGIRWAVPASLDRGGSADDLGAIFHNVEVLEENRLPLANRWSHACQVIDTNWVAIEWMAIGCASGAYAAALRHSRDTEFSRRDSIERAMVQDSLNVMGANLSAAISRCRRMSALSEKGATAGVQSSTASADRMGWMKETVELGVRVVGTVNPPQRNEMNKFTADSDRIALFAASLAVDAPCPRRRWRARPLREAALIRRSR